MRLDQVLHDGQTEPRAAFLARAAGAHTVEALEDAGQVIRPDAGAGVTDSHDNAVSSSLRGDPDLAALRRVPQGGVEQIGAELPQCLSGRGDGRGSRRAFGT